MLGQQLPRMTIDERDLPRLSNGDQSLREMLADKPRRSLARDQTPDQMSNTVTLKRVQRLIDSF